MEKRISSIREKVKTRPTCFYSPELKKEILDIRDELAFLGWTRKQIQSALGVGHQSMDAWSTPKIKMKRIQIVNPSLHLISPTGWQVKGLDLADLKVLLS